MSNINVMIDPFFDERDEDGQLMVYGGDKYRKGAELNEIMSGHSMVLRGGGRSAVMIPRSTQGGLPQGLKPHDTQQKVVHYDPHIPGQSVTLNLGKVTTNSVKNAETAVGDQIPVVSLATQRLHGAAVLHEIANASPINLVAEDAYNNANEAPMEIHQPQQAYVAPPSAPVQAVQPQPVVAPQQFVTPAPQQMQQPIQHVKQAEAAPRVVSPLQSFNSPQVVQQMTNPAVAAVPTQSAAPTFMVNFEIEGFGTFQAHYHDVIVKTGFIVLVYDKRWQGGAMYFPPVSAGENQPKIAMNVAGSDDTYLVAPTGIQYEMEGRELFHVLITKSSKMQNDGQPIG